MAVTDVPEQLGGEEGIRRAFEQAAANTELFERHQEAWLAEHEGQWVAVQQGNHIFNSSLEDLIKQASQLGWDLGTMLVRKLESRRPALLL